MTIVSPLEIVTRGPARAAARLFRYDGRLHVVVIAKTRLMLAADGPMRAVVPPDVTAREAVPYRPAADITFTGKVHGTPSPQTFARLALLRPSTPGGPLDSAQTLLNKTTSTFEIEGFGPIPTSARHAIMPAEERASVDAPMPELRSTTNFAYFNRAPVDQRTVPLRGDEWVWLERLHPSAEYIVSQLPMLRAIGSIRLLHQEKPFVMRIDSLAVDGDGGYCDVLARGSFAVASTGDLERMAAIAGFDVGVVASPSPGPRAERGTMVLEPGAEPALERRASTVIMEPAAEPAPLTVMPSSLEDLTMVDEGSAPATRAPFPLIQPGTGRSASGDIPGAPWAAGEAPKVKPATEARFGTIGSDEDEAEALRLELERRLREAGEKTAVEEAKTKDAAKRKVESVKWRNLPEEQAQAPKVPAAPPVTVGAPTAAVKKSLYDRFRKR